MSTKLEIFNRALAEIGHNRILTATTATVESMEQTRLNLVWDSSRKSVLSAHEWNWLVAETQLTEGAECEEDGAHLGWYYWSRPEGYLRILAVVDEQNKRVDYDTANQLIYAQVPSIRFRYLPDSEDPADWPVHVVDAVVYEIAARISIPMTASGKTMAAMKQLSAAILQEAILHDSQEMRRMGSNGRKYADSRN